MRPYTLIHNNVWTDTWSDNSRSSTDVLDRVMKMEDENIAHMEKINDECRKAGSLKFRCFQLQVADGYAYYQVMEVGSRTVKVRHISGIGDNYKDDILGDGGTFPLIPIRKLIEAEDKFNDLIAKRQLA